MFLCILLIDWLSFGEELGEGIRLELDVQGQGGEIILDVDGQGGRGLKKWTIFMDVMYASLLNLILTLTLDLLLPSIVFYNKICVFIMIFMALSFFRLIHSLSFI